MHRQLVHNKPLDEGQTNLPFNDPVEFSASEGWGQNGRGHKALLGAKMEAVNSLAFTLALTAGAAMGVAA